MKEDLTDILDLMNTLGYSDDRSVKKWCKRNNIPIISLGLRKYVLSQLLTQYIDNQLVIFVNGNKSVENSSKKITDETSKNNTKKFVSENETVNKYLAKYESISKSDTNITRKTTS